VSPVLFEWCKTDNIKALEEARAMGWVDDDINIELSGFTEEA